VLAKETEYEPALLKLNTGINDDEEIAEKPNMIIIEPGANQFEIMFDTPVAYAESVRSKSKSNSFNIKSNKESVISAYTTEKLLDLTIKSEIVSHEMHKFVKIMKLDNLSPADVIQSLSVEENIEQVFQAGEGAGLSGCFFFFSKDKRFLIKTIAKSEIEVLLGMLDDMIKHFEDTNNQSLLARIYGVFTIKTDKFHSLNIIIMQNTCRTQDISKQLKFDLKGSVVNRKVKLPKQAERFW
jgi:hypothetical protein